MIYYILTVIALIASPALSYSTGAPKDVCSTLAPQHGDLVSQETPPPYTLEVSTASVDAEEPIIITIKGNGDDDLIKGFIIQARSDGNPVGNFVVVDENASQTLDCLAPGDTLTHKKILKKLNKIETKWIPSKGLKGQNIQIVATVVQRGDIFWVQKLNTAVQVA